MKLLIGGSPTIQLGDAFQVRDPGWALPWEAST